MIEMVVDRVKKDVAVLLVNINDKEEAIKLPAILLPKGVKEGDVIKASFEIDSISTGKIKQQAVNLLEEILSKQNK